VFSGLRIGHWCAFNPNHSGELLLKSFGDFFLFGELSLKSFSCFFLSARFFF